MSRLQIEFTPKQLLEVYRVLGSVFTLLKYKKIYLSHYERNYIIYRNPQIKQKPFQYLNNRVFLSRSYRLIVALNLEI